MYFCALAGYIIGQTPGFNYQAVLRNASGETMNNAEVTLHFSLIDVTNTVIYKENQTLTTDDLGILTCMIGTGTVETGAFEEITGVQDLAVKIEAQLPGESSITNIGESKLGVIPYALYGKDEDADPDNEIQELSLEGDSLKISGMGGLPIKSLNYWEKTDSGYTLEIDDLSRDLNKGIVINGRDPLRLLQLIDKVGTRSIGSLSEETNIDGEVVESHRVIKDAGAEFSEGFKDAFNVYHPGLDLQGKSGVEVTQFEYEKGIVRDVTGPRTVNKHGGNYNSGSDITADGCNIFGAYNNSKMFNAFSDQNLGAVGADVYKLGVNAFGLGFIVSCPPSTNISHRSAATFGGTFSTANDNGLTTLLGALPGLDPTNGYNIVFNGLKLGVSSTINAELAGTSSTYGANGQLNTTAGTFAGDADGGALITYDQNGNTGAYVWTKNDGTSQMGADQFVMTTQAPGRSSEVATFSAPMGGEAAAYDRGTANLVNGEATVVCPEHFGWIADDKSMTVTITPLSAESKGIAVIEKSNGGFKVKELNGGTGNYSFDYLVMCKRKDFKQYEVVRKKPQIIPDKSTEILKELPKRPLNGMRDLVTKRNTG